MTADDLSLIAQVEALRAELDRERHLARHDPLTGALNRRGGLEAIASLSPPFAIALVDLDHFRRVNRLPGGYRTGDAVLCEVATLLASDGRPEDLLIRWGGEEFLLVLDGADEAGALRRLERVLAEARRRIRAGRVLVTFSAGVAAVASGGEFEPVLAAANRALQRAKAAGRGRVLSGVSRVA